MNLETGAFVLFVTASETPSGYRLPTNDELSSYQQKREQTKNNTEIYTQLYEIDNKSIRALRNGETDRLATLEEQSRALRAQLAN